MLMVLFAGLLLFSTLLIIYDKGVGSQQAQGSSSVIQTPVHALIKQTPEIAGEDINITKSPTPETP
jgi:hypothetical protein